MERPRKVGISLGVLLTAISGPTIWLLANVWALDKVTVQEPRFPLLVIETIAVGLAGLFGLVSIIYFWRLKWGRY